ncbi:hypothetical protein [Cupriavidus sp. SK-3]|uniref:hypothetical protein n=1 Tax=Cupriavidus sp. SK-3 TaxID=1470558 RepID=UPI001268938B|nr:hypothetical protein [Cupriavidus sp. SK-3]
MNVKRLFSSRSVTRFAFSITTLCITGVTLAESAVTPEQHFPTGYLESVAHGYEDSQGAPTLPTNDTQAPPALTPEKPQKTGPSLLKGASFLVAPETPPSSPDKKKQK